MAFSDFFKGNQYKTELDILRNEYEELKSLITPEMQNALTIKQEILRLQMSRQTN